MTHTRPRFVDDTGELPDCPPGYASRMPFYPQATSLEGVTQNRTGKWIQLEPETAKAWRALRRAAEVDGVVLELLSGYRSHRDQAAIVARKQARGETLDAILRCSAYPGFSEHHTGRALDIGTPGYAPLEETFAESPAFAWLESRAVSFGFRLSYPRGNPQGIVYEPWHWFYVDPEPLSRAHLDDQL